MQSNFFFYDLETSGINPRSSRIMQFAGQRTDIELNPIGDPYNFLIKLSEDVIPEPGAILVTGITPQQTISEGITEAEFFKIFNQEISKNNTIFVGFNNVRFDDEFIRFGLYRNFYDSYEWQWKDGRSRWDVLDLSRITRALRPDGIKWPFATDGKPTNRLEFISSVNSLDHFNAHDALSDVNATIAVARLIKEKQPKLFEFMLNIRTKKEVSAFVDKNDVFVYVSGKYSSEHEKLAVVKNIGKHPTKNDAVLVCDLTTDLTKFADFTPIQLAESLRYDKDKMPEDRLPVKTLQFNKCPAIAPITTLDDESKKRLKIDQSIIDKNLKTLKSNPTLIKNIFKAFKTIETGHEQAKMIVDDFNVDSLLYDAFLSDFDRKVTRDVLKASPEKLSDFVGAFKDERMNRLLPLYKARNYSKNLTTDEVKNWEKYKLSVYSKNLPNFINQFEQISSSMTLSKKDTYTLEELRMYVESLMPTELYG